MPGSEDYRRYLEKCFESVDEKLDAILAQATKTNNRVTHLEDKSNERQVVIDDFRHLEKEFDCVKNKVEKIDKDLLEVWFFKKYPRVFLGIIVVAIISALILIRTKLNTVNDNMTDLKEQVDIINVPMRTRGGEIKYIPSVQIYDSLYKGKNIKK